MQIFMYIYVYQIEKSPANPQNFVTSAPRISLKVCPTYLYVHQSAIDAVTSKKHCSSTSIYISNKSLHFDFSAKTPLEI